MITCHLMWYYHTNHSFHHYRLKMKHFKKFQDTTEALAGNDTNQGILFCFYWSKFVWKWLQVEFLLIIAATAAVEGKMSKPLKKLMKKVIASDAQEELAVSDAKLGNVIKVMDKKLKVVFSTKKCFKKWLCNNFILFYL